LRVRKKPGRGAERDTWRAFRAALNIRIVNASLADIHGAIGAGIGGAH